MFEQEYKRANDRIHPRKDLLKELEAQWAKEADQPKEEMGKVVAFPVWARYAAMAAGVLLCLGVGMGSVMLFTRDRGSKGMRLAAEAPMAMDSAVMQEEAQILTMPAAVAEAAVTEAAAEDAVAGGTLLESKAAQSACEPPKGTHPAVDEAEVESALRFGGTVFAAVQNASDGQEPQAGGEGDTKSAPATKGQAADDRAPDTETRSAQVPEARGSSAGQLFRRGELTAVYQPTTDRFHVIQYANRKVTNIFSLTLREAGAQVRQLFWMDSQLLALRERDGETELMRFGVADWKNPTHLRSLTQSGALLGAGEMGGRLYILTRYEATEEQPLPLVNGVPVAFGNVLLDSDRPGDAFAVLTVYDPAQDAFVSETALLAPIDGVAFGHEKLLLWTSGAETDLYAFASDPTGVSLLFEGTRPGTVLDAVEAGDGFSLLLQTGDGVAWITLDGDLNEAAASTAQGVGPVKWARAYEGGAALLTEDTLHWLTDTGDKTLAIAGDGLSWLTADRALVVSADGKLQVVTMNDDGLALLAAIQVREDLTGLLEDLSRVSYDAATCRLAFPAGQKVYQYKLDATGKNEPRGSSMVVTGQSADEQRELRCLLTEDRLLIFYRDGIILCNENLVKQNTTKY